MDEAVKQKFTLHPLYNVTAVLNNWKVFSQGVERVLHYANGDIDMTSILNDILGKAPNDKQQYLMWIGLLDNEYCGFITTRTERHPTTLNTLAVMSCYIKKGTDKNIFLEGMEKMQTIAKKWGYDRIVFRTTRSGWEKKLLNKGWKTGYTEYIYSLNDKKEEQS